MTIPGSKGEILTNDICKVCTVRSVALFQDLETGLKATVSSEGIKPVYMQELRTFLAAYEKGCADVRADYKLFDTRQPLELALSEYLFRRSRMGK